jgi:ubiquinol-cytochrome c reductase cytochrome c1 subunit
MFKKLAISTALSLALLPAAAIAAGGGDQHIEDFDFSFEGPFGVYDQNQLQRGLHVFTDLCSGCHGLKFVPLRTLADEGGPELPMEQVRAYAADNFEVFDADLDDYRPATPVDHFPANTALGAPDLSVMAKARAGFHGPYGLGINQMFKGMGGPEYIASVLSGYTGHEKEEAGAILYENTAFPGGWIAMPPPIEDESIEFMDGHANDLHHISEDVSAFLMWTAEPKMMARKQVGFMGVLILAIFSVLLYLTNKRIWAPLKGRKIKQS